MTVEESARPAAAGIKAVGQAIRPHCRSLAWVLLTICMAAAAHRLPAAARPEHPPADLGGGQAVLTAGMLSDTAAALNRQVQADPGLRGRIAVVDTSRGGLDAVRRDTLLLAYRTADSRIAAGRVNPDDIRDLAGHLGYAGASATSGTPDSGGYFCFAVPPAPGVTAAWMDLVTSRATGVPGLRLAGHTTARVTVRLAAAHELGHCLAGLEPKFKDDDLASRLWNETLADTFAALWHLANGGTAADLQRFASLRDLRLGYAP
jgi:hypothetical protein